MRTCDPNGPLTFPVYSFSLYYVIRLAFCEFTEPSCSQQPGLVCRHGELEAHQQPCPGQYSVVSAEKKKQLAFLVQLRQRLTSNLIAICTALDRQARD